MLNVGDVQRMTFTDADDPPRVSPLVAPNAPKHDIPTGAAKEVNKTTPELKEALLMLNLPRQTVGNAAAIKENAANADIELRKMVIPCTKAGVLRS
jgi:hypothetical protein